MGGKGILRGVDGEENVKNGAECNLLARSRSLFSIQIEVVFNLTAALR